MRRVLCLLALATLTACGGTTGPSMSQIQYRVTGTAATADVTYESAGGSTSQQGDVALPWTYGMGAGTGAFVYISAQNSTDTGCVRTEILIDGNVYKDSGESCGAFVIATASGSVP